jgi:hypothetical protein
MACCFNCKGPLAPATRRRTRDALFICGGDDCRLAMRMHTVNALHKALSPAVRVELEELFSFRGRNIYTYGKDLALVKAAAAACTAEHKAECTFNFMAINASILNPRRAVPVHHRMRKEAPVKLFPSLYLAMHKGMAALAACKQPLSTITHMTLENVSEFVDQASRVREFGELAADFAYKARAPDDTTFAPAGSDLGFASIFTDGTHEFDLGLVLRLTSEPALRTYANQVARRFLEDHLEDATTDFMWPWLYIKLESVTTRVSDAMIASYVEREGEAALAARTWSRETHLAVVRPWGIKATQTLLLVLYRELGAPIADALLESIVAYV